MYLEILYDFTLMFDFSLDCQLPLHRIRFKKGESGISSGHQAISNEEYASCN